MVRPLPASGLFVHQRSASASPAHLSCWGAAVAVTPAGQTLPNRNVDKHKVYQNIKGAFCTHGTDEAPPTRPPAEVGSTVGHNGADLDGSTTQRVWFKAALV